MQFLSVLAMAAPQGDPSQAQGMQGMLTGMVLPTAVIFVIFYFLLIRPQSKKAKEHRELISNLKKGDKVITSGGIYGLVESVGDKTITLKVAENTKVKFGKSFIADVRATAEED
jgi:preprotein translocase subunit YajC